MFTTTFIRDAAERALKTFVQTLLVFLGVDAFDVISADWTGGLSLSLGAAVLSLLTSVISLPAGGNGTASLIPEVTSPAGRHSAGE